MANEVRRWLTTSADAGEMMGRGRVPEVVLVAEHWPASDCCHAFTGNTQSGVTVAFWRKRDDDFGAVAGRFASPVEQAEPTQSQMLAATLHPS
jgi:hypothetical protein